MYSTVFIIAHIHNTRILYFVKSFLLVHALSVMLAVFNVLMVIKRVRQNFLVYTLERHYSSVKSAKKFTLLGTNFQDRSSYFPAAE
jgi:hypothetical protein